VIARHTPKGSRLAAPAPPTCWSFRLGRPIPPHSAMEPAPKRQRADAEPLGSPLGSPLSDGLLAPAAQDAVRERYASALPYCHSVIEPLCDPERMALVKEEITRNLRADFKETDLFKLYQTIDLANLSLTHSDQKVRELSAKMPQLLALRNALYTPGFRTYMQRITGCPELTDRVDMAASIFTQGCHLLCHDDVIGTRAVSFIVYLSGEDWQLSDGGALELYPLEGQDADTSLQQGVPAPHPVANVLPKFNSMAIFAVKPGRSYHSVQEVYADRTPRLSIQGWYHAAAPPPDIEKASLSQLKAAGSTDSSRFTPLQGVVRYPEAQEEHGAAGAAAEAANVGTAAAGSAAGGVATTPKVAPAALAAYEAAWALSDADRQFLAGWVHPTYLKEEYVVSSSASL
jgi:Rps23 Pro-64 3,4-dihydroxylase Tpa1-like proline 4-hydroxylase